LEGGVFSSAPLDSASLQIHCSAPRQSCTYANDDLTRIAGANCGAAAAQTFSYDPFGNINKSGSPYSFQPTYSPSTNRMTSLPGFTPTYDANGNLLNDNSHAYTWDADGNSVTVDGVALTYDALDRMVEQNRSGSYTQIVYAPTGGKLALMSGQSLVKAFIPLPGQATAVYTGSGLDHYRHSDWLGSARLTSSPSQAYLASVAYAPFGETYAQSGSADLSFTGQNSDTVSGDYDFLFREYSMQGRWPSPDPAGLAAVNPVNPQSWNRYGYVLNNPLRAIDPLGLDCVFLNDAGDGIEEIAPELDASACGDQGGVYFAGTIDPNSLQFDPNSDYVFAEGAAGNSQFSCGGANCDQGSLDAFANSLFDPSSVTVTASQSGNSSWAWTFTKTFFSNFVSPQFYKQELKQGGCLNTFVHATGNALIPTPLPSVSTTAGAGTMAVSAAMRYNAAQAYAASRTNVLGGQGLIFPQKSIPYNNILEGSTVTSLAEGGLGYVDGALFQGLLAEAEAAYNGNCH